MVDEGLRHGPDDPLGDQCRTGNLQKWAARHKLRERYLILAWNVKHPQELCSSSAKMSPQNCSAILSPPRLGSSSQKGRRSDEGVGAKGEPEKRSIGCIWCG